LLLSFYGKKPEYPVAVAGMNGKLGFGRGSPIFAFSLEDPSQFVAGDLHLLNPFSIL